jgi:UBX domain-containing protein 1
LDDPANAEFLRDLARGQTPRELLTDASSGTGAGAGAGGAAGGSVVVGLIDKRKEEYVEEFRSFMGEGNSMQPSATAAPAASGIFDPATLPTTPPATPAAGSTDATSIQIRLLSGARQVVRISLSSTVADLAAHLRSPSDTSRFQLIAGFPPKPLQDPTATILDAGLKGAQVTMKKVA